MSSMRDDHDELSEVVPWVRAEANWAANGGQVQTAKMLRAAVDLIEAQEAQLAALQRERERILPVYNAALPLRGMVEASIWREDRDHWKRKMQAFVDAIETAIASDSSDSPDRGGEG